MKKFPHVYVILFIIIIIAAILTYIVPANQYDFQLDAEGNPTKLIDPNSYHPVDANPINPWEMMLAIPKGMGEVASIIFFIFIVGGSFNIIQATGAVEAGIRATIKNLQGKEVALLFIIVLLFSIGGTTFGMAEEALVFIPLLVPLAIAMGYDSLTGLALALVGPCAGFTGAFLNPFTIAVAQGIVGLPTFSGLEYRVVIWVCTTLLAFGYIYWYASKVKKNPEISIMYEEDKKRAKIEFDAEAVFTGRQKATLIFMLLTFVVLVWGVIKFGWWIDEIAALFLSMGIICGLIGGLWPSKIADAFVEGAMGLTVGALVVGIARAILVVLKEGAILHTIVHFLAGLVAGMPVALSAIGMYIVQLIISVVIPSGSGMASVTMPIMGPLATLLGMTQQLAVLVYQFADGFTNIIIPTSGYLLAGVALAKVPYEKWVKWYWPLFWIFCALGAIFIVIGQVIKFGPF
ncbi:MAG: YfcC family protein [Chloroflexota bacterium]